MASPVKAMQKRPEEGSSLDGYHWWLGKGSAWLIDMCVVD
ncbi:hypothetical protein VIBRN418_01061 [Vibrio sp. N418]|nr:hypothetical protein VIBRN418_01061 [Vibrio sp. N418]